MVRITTWNVNGIRNPLGYQPWSRRKTYDAMFDILEADVVVMQELKIQRKDLTDDMVLVPGWDCYFSLPKHKKGYSGVGIYTRQAVCAPIRAEEGILGVLCPPGSPTPYRELPNDASIGGYPTVSQVVTLGIDPEALDAEGRCLVLEFPAFVLFGVYSPANSNGLRDDFRHGFLAALDMRIRNLTAMGKNVILTGDLNVSRDLIDTAKAEENMRSEGMTLDQYLGTPNRRLFNQLLLNGRVPGQRDEGRESPVLYDLCREFHPTREGMFTHWEQKINARPGNFGSRIDFILCSITIKDWFSEANIQEGLMGSDHCPVYAVIKDKVSAPESSGLAAERSEVLGERHILDLLNPNDVFQHGIRQREYSLTKDIPALSGRLLPEFTKRRSIRDMFNRTPSVAKPSSTPSSTIEANLKTNDPSLNSLPPLDGVTANGLGLKDETPISTPTANGNCQSTSVSQSPVPSQKRSRPSVSPGKPVKRTKVTQSTSSHGVATGEKCQQSLKNFLQPRTTSKDPHQDAIAPRLSSNKLTDHANAFLSASQPCNNSGLLASSSVHTLSDPLTLQEASKEGWTKLFSKKPSPRCEGHADPCVLLTTKKPGVNCGRQFWMCSRPVGPSGQKENGTQWRCGTFIWASDWKV